MWFVAHAPIRQKFFALNALVSCLLIISGIWVWLALPASRIWAVAPGMLFPFAAIATTAFKGRLPMPYRFVILDKRKLK